MSTFDEWDDLPEGINPYDRVIGEALGQIVDGIVDLADEVETPIAEGQEALFGDDQQFHRAWRLWDEMPEFIQDDLEPWATLIVKFRTPEDRQAFAELVGQPIRGLEPRGIWFPKLEIGRYWDLRYIDATARGSNAETHRPGAGEDAGGVG